MTTYLASIFMNVRYGPDSTHGFGKTLAYNYLAAEGAFKYDPGSGRFAVDAAKLGVAARMLASEVLTIMALGDYERAAEVLAPILDAQEPLPEALLLQANILGKQGRMEEGQAMFERANAAKQVQQAGQRR